MSPEFHQRARDLFERALARTEAERLPFLHAQCAGNTELFEAVERLLRVRDRASCFLEKESPAERRVGRYVISHELGRGGMGVVYEAMDPLIGRSIAVKVIRIQTLADPGSAGFLRDRLFREARSAGSLSHTGIVTIFDVGADGDEAFIIMERIIGPSLQEFVTARQRLDTKRVLDILSQTAAALDYAHSNRVVHRDIKPANIMLSNGATVKITDFGIAKVVSDASETLTGFSLGTPSYMSPEQIEAQPVDGRSDQFSLAAVAYQMLTGCLPFQADSVPSLLHTIIYGERPSARAVNPELPEAVDEVLKRGLNRNPIRRYATCSEFSKALADAARSGTTPMPAKEPDPHAKRPGKRRAAFVAGFLAAAVVLIIVIPGAVERIPGFQTTRVQSADLSVVPARQEAKLPPANTPAVDVAPLPESDSPRPAPQIPKLIDDSARAMEIYQQAMTARNAAHLADRIALLRQAAEMGSIPAMNELGQIFMNADTGNSNSDDPGVSADEALRWLRAAAKLRNTSAMESLGAMYVLGKGVDVDPETAAEWFRQAADAGDNTAMYDLGMLYESGTGVPEDPAQARELYEKAAAKGNLEAKHRLAQMQ